MFGRKPSSVSLLLGYTQLKAVRCTFLLEKGENQRQLEVIYDIYGPNREATEKL